MRQNKTASRFFMEDKKTQGHCANHNTHILPRGSREAAASLPITSLTLLWYYLHLNFILNLFKYPITELSPLPDRFQSMANAHSLGPSSKPSNQSRNSIVSPSNTFLMSLPKALCAVYFHSPQQVTNPTCQLQVCLW